MTTLTRINWQNHLTTALEGSKFVRSLACIPNAPSTLSKHVIKNLAGMLSRGQSFQLRYIGNVVILDKKPRPGCNPKTGERVEIDARKSISLRKKPVDGIAKRQGVVSQLVLSAQEEGFELDLPLAFFVYDTFCDFLRNIPAGDRLEIRNFGVFEMRTYAPREAHNPKSGAQVTLGERTGLHFSASDKILGVLNS